MTLRELVGGPALVITSLVIGYVLLCEVLHVTGRRWRPGVPETVAVVAAAGAVALVMVRFFVLT